MPQARVSSMIGRRTLCTGPAGALEGALGGTGGGPGGGALTRSPPSTFSQRRAVFQTP